MRCSTFSLLVADRLLRPPQVAGFLRPINEGIEDLISLRSFLILLFWAAEDWVRWLRPSWKTLLPCVSVVTRLLKWESKSRDKLAPLGRSGKALQYRGWTGTALGSTLWRSWSADAVPNESYPLTKCVLGLRFLWRGRNVIFRASHFLLHLRFAVSIWTVVRE